MSDSSRKASNGAVEQIMRNMTSDIHSSDGQYIHGFTPPASPQDTWNLNSQVSQPPFIPYQLQTPEPSLGYSIEHQFAQQIPFSYLQQQQQVYQQDLFDKHMDVNFAYNNHPNLVYPQDAEYNPFKVCNLKVPDPNYINSNDSPIYQENTCSPTIQNRTPLIDNFAGNWAPNTSGTYSIFGNVATFNTSQIFDSSQDLENNIIKQVLEEPKVLELNDDTPNFQFNRDTKKPRMVAEVKPMRPSYSDVLLKSAPVNQLKTNKTENKETKVKKDTKKNGKNDKNAKTTAVLSRSNTSNEIKDISGEKNGKNPEKTVKDVKIGNLTRKWASLDNVTETSNDFKAELNEGKKIKNNSNNKNIKQKQKIVGKLETNENEANTSKNDSVSSNKAVLKKGVKITGRQRNFDSSFGSNERPPGKRSQRNRKRDNQVPFGVIGQKLKEYLGWWKYIVKFFMWLFHLVSDVLSLSIHLSKDMGGNFYSWFLVHSANFIETSVTIFKRMKFVTWIMSKFHKEIEEEPKLPFPPTGLHNNINMPATGEEAMKRLLACKGKDPYSILGVVPTCTDSDIKNYYKKQAKLVHPDKNQQPGAEEAFKILVHAFDMIGEPERRATYDRGVAESAQVEQAMTKFTELLVQLQQKVEAAANTIRCSSCGLRHKRVKVDRQCYSARNCKTCKIHHSAKEGDIWAEARCFGFLWHYYACMDGGVFDITEWAGCQKDSLKHLQPDSHNVQYRIALGKQANGPPKKFVPPRNQTTPPDLDNLINSFYGQNDNNKNMRRKTKKAK